MKIWATIVLITFALLAKGQINLVPNPSFENYLVCPDYPASGYDSLLDWFNPTNNSPDYYNVCCTQPYPIGATVPKHFQGFQYPRTGNGYTGIGVYDPVSDSREYIAVALTDSLQPRTYYCVSFYISLSNISTYAIKHFGLYFSAVNPYIPTTTTLPYNPQIRSEKIEKDTLNWMLVSRYYYATGGEKYLTIGNFNDRLHTVVDSVSSDWHQVSYYYIDDVSVSECEKPNNPLVTPNVFTPNNDGHNDVLIFENLPEQSSLSIYNRWGNLMYSHRNYANNWRAENVSDGVYFYILKLPNGESKHGTLQIIR